MGWLDTDGDTEEPTVLSSDGDTEPYEEDTDEEDTDEEDIHREESILSPEESLLVPPSHPTLTSRRSPTMSSPSLTSPTMESLPPSSINTRLWGLKCSFSQGPTITRPLPTTLATSTTSQTTMTPVPSPAMNSVNTKASKSSEATAPSQFISARQYLQTYTVDPTVPHASG